MIKTGMLCYEQHTRRIVIHNRIKERQLKYWIELRMKDGMFQRDYNSTRER